MPAKRRDPRVPTGLLSPAEARRRLTSLIRELEAQPSLRIPIGVGTAQAVLVTPELLERLDAAAKAGASATAAKSGASDTAGAATARGPAVPGDPRPESRKAAPGKGRSDRPASSRPRLDPPAVDGDDAPDPGVQRLVKKLIKSVKE